MILSYNIDRPYAQQSKGSCSADLYGLLFSGSIAAGTTAEEKEKLILESGNKLKAGMNNCNFFLVFAIQDKGRSNAAFSR